MNNSRRKELANLIDRIEAMQGAIDDIKGDLEAVRDDEQEYRDNMPESLGDGDKGQRADEVVSTLDDALGDLGDIESTMETIRDALNAAAE